MSLINSLYRKTVYELQNVFALASFHLTGAHLVRRLERSMPGIVIETTNICNANCVFCAYQFQTRPKGVMEMSLFKKIVSEYVEVGGGSLSLTPTVGEPFADSLIVERIRFAREHAAIKDIGMYSNMISLERIGIQALLTSGLTSLMVSTSGPDEQMYERVYRSREYKRVLRNIMAFAEANSNAGHPVRFFVDMRADRPAHEVYEFPDYKILAEAIGPENIGIKYRYDNWGGKITQDQLSGAMKLRAGNNPLRPRTSACSEMYSGPMIYWDGRVGACGCRDVDARELIIGDATKQHIADIWFGEELKKLRAEFLSPAIRDICRNCTHYNPVSIVLRPDHKGYREGLIEIDRTDNGKIPFLP